jgi:hypothetical protein
MEDHIVRGVAREVAPHSLPDHTGARQALRPLRTGRAWRTISARWTLWTLRTRCARSAVRARRALRPLSTRRARSAIRARWPLWSLRTRRARSAISARRTLGTLRTCRTGSALRARRALRTLRTRRARSAIRARRTLRTNGTRSASRSSRAYERGGVLRRAIGEAQASHTRRAIDGDVADELAREAGAAEGLAEHADARAGRA